MPDFLTKIVGALGGGLNFAAAPADLRDDQWTWGDGYLAKNGYAETGIGYTPIAVSVAGGAGIRVLGIFQNPFDANNAALVVVKNTATSLLRLFSLNDAGTYTEILWDGIGAQPTAGGQVACAAFINGFFVFSGGASATIGTPGIMRWNPTVAAGKFSAVSGVQFGAEMLAAFAGHLIAAGVLRTQAGARGLTISDANSETFPAPAVGNSADATVLTDSISGITGLLPFTGNLCAVFTRQGLHGLAPTGSNPPFTLQFLASTPCTDQLADSGLLPTRHSLLGNTPHGPIFRGVDDFYLGSQGVGRRIFNYYRKTELRNLVTPLVLSGVGYMPFLHWNPALGLVVVPTTNLLRNGQESEFLYYDPVSETWSRSAAGNTDVYLAYHAIITDNRHGTGALCVDRHWVVGPTGNALVSGTPYTGAFFDTKDFALNDRTGDFYVDRIKVDWEGTANGSTETLDVLAWAHNDLGLQGSPGEEPAQASIPYVPLGTLTAGGSSELPVRLRGKYVRFRFLQNALTNRIRGFSFTYQAASGKIT